MARHQKEYVKAAIAKAKIALHEKNALQLRTDGLDWELKKVKKKLKKVGAELERFREELQLANEELDKSREEVSALMERVNELE